MTKTTDGNGTVLIAGAGPVGLALAVGLRRFGIDCRVVDAAAERSIHSKALGVAPRTLEAFGRAGPAERAVAAGHPVRGGRLHAAGRAIGEIDVRGVESAYPFVLILPQSETERLLAERLEELGGGVERSVALSGFTQDAAGVTATLRHADGREEAARSAWLVGCDGAHSAVRHGLGFDFAGSRYAEGFVLADLRVEFAVDGDALPDDRLNVFLHRDGFLAFFPMGDKCPAAAGRPLWRIVADLPAATVPSDAAPSRPTLAELQALVDVRGPGGLRLAEPVWTSGFNVSRRQAPRYRDGRVFLAGDAAHIHSPAGGQGMNTGIQDAENLAWKLATTVRGDAGTGLLDSYEAERRPVAARVLRLTDRMTKAVTLHDPVAGFLRDRLAGALKLPAVGRRAAAALSELDVRYPRSPIVGESWHDGLPGFLERGPRPGDRAPDATVLDPQTGGAVRLFDLFRRAAGDGPGHTLLLFAAPDATADDVARLIGLTESVRALRSLAASPLLALAAAPASPVGCPTFLDPEGVARGRYATSAECLYLIRPDGVVGHRSRSPRLDAVAAYAAGLTA